VGGVGLRTIDIVLAAQWPWHLDASSSHEQAQAALHACDVAHLEHAQWQTLSGGERQRVSLAACFAQNTQVILLDEPTSHLDIGHQVTLLNTLVQQSDNCEQAIIASMHDIGLIQRGFTHALLLMNDGSYLAGSLSEVINPINLERSLGHPISTAQTATGQTIYVPV
jgi:iron complex transport system ATP-binding protein